MAETSITLTLGYKNTDFVRKYKFNKVTSAAAASAKAKVLAYNANIPEADKRIFISDDYDADNDIGTFEKIVAAQYETTEYTRIPLN